MSNFIKILILLIPCACTVHGIQVYENITNDITTSTTKLVIVPTPTAENNVPANGNVTSSNMDLKEQSEKIVNNTASDNKPQEQNSRKKEKENIKDGRNIAKVEQHEKTSSNVKHEKFVPSPEISLSGIVIPEPVVPQTTSNDNFYPVNQYYRPVKHSVHFHSSSPITSTNSNWKHSQSLDSLPKSFPKFEDEVNQYKETEKFTLPPSSYDNNKWFFMQEKLRVETTEKPPRPSGSGKWKWVSDEEEQDTRNPTNNYNPLTPSSFPSFPSFPSIPSIPPNDFSYTFEIPSTDSTPFSFGSTKYDGFDQSNIEGPSTTLSTSDSEWESPLTSSNGKLKHKSKGYGKGANISPWKKILHVLTAAIPIGLLISALTPQVIYVDPNSTSSISPSNSLSLLSTTKQRSLDRGTVQLSEPNDLQDNQSGRKFMSNPLMDFLHVLHDGNSMERNDSCDDRKFCEASRSGAEPNANVLNKMLWKIANETPEFQARKSGLEHIFQAIRNNNCSIFECKKQELNNHRQNYRKN